MECHLSQDVRLPCSPNGHQKSELIRVSGTEKPSRSVSAMQRPRRRPGNPTALHQRASAGRSGWRRVGEPSAAACTAQKLLCGRAAGGTGAASSDRRHPGQCSRRISQEGRWDLARSSTARGYNCCAQGHSHSGSGSSGPSRCPGQGRARGM